MATQGGASAERHLDWGNPEYLASLAQKVRAGPRRVGGELVLIGVSYSGYGVATLASHHPELRPDRLIAIDTYLELVPRRAALPASHQTARDIDAETSGSASRARGPERVCGRPRPPRQDRNLTVRHLDDLTGGAAGIQRRHL